MLERMKHEDISRAPRIYVIVSGNWPAGSAAHTQFEKHVGVRVDWSSCVVVRSHVAPRQLCEATRVGDMGATG
jgi:hypothetical protein